MAHAAASSQAAAFAAGMSQQILQAMPEIGQRAISPFEGGAQFGAGSQDVPPTQQDNVEREAKRGRMNIDDDQAEIDDMIKKVVQDCKIPKEVLQQLNKVVAKFKDMIEKRERIKQKKATFLEAIQQINAGRWPNGIKPFSPGFECPELDQAFPDAIGKEYIFSTKVPSKLHDS